MVTLYNLRNNAESTLASDLSAGATTLQLPSGDTNNFPDAPFPLTIWNADSYPDPADDSNMEIVHVSDVDTDNDTLQIVKAVEGTDDVSHSTGEKVALLLTAGYFESMNYGVKGYVADRVQQHAEVTAQVHNFDAEGKAPPQLHASSAHSGTIGNEGQIAWDSETGHYHDGTTTRKVDHLNLLNIGSYTHGNIDSHINSTSNVHNFDSNGRAPPQNHASRHQSGGADALSHSDLPDLDADTHSQYARTDGSRTMTGSLDMGMNNVTNMAAPTSDSDAATKAYVDSIEQGLDIKDSVRAASTANIDLSTGGLLTVDDVSLTADDRVLVKDQSTASENGIYLAKSGSWVRAPDADEDSEVTSGLFCYVEEGTDNANRSFILITSDPIAVGSDALDFTIFSKAGLINAGTGLTKAGDTLNLKIESSATNGNSETAISSDWAYDHTNNAGAHHSKTTSLSEISDSGALAALDKVTDAEINAETSNDGQVLESNGDGTVSWGTNLQTHIGNSSAHHSKTTSLTEITDSGDLASLDKVQDTHVDSETSSNGQVLMSNGDGTANWGTINVFEKGALSVTHTKWSDGLSDVEIGRMQLQSGETLTVERIEFQQKGGGSSSSASVDVYDNSASSVIGSANLGSVTKDAGSSGSGNLVLFRLSNNTGGTIDASVVIHYAIEGA